MKKIITLLLILFTVVACKNVTIIDDSKQLKIIAPTGAPSLAFLNEINNPNFETNSNPSNIVAMMSDQSSFDIVCIDTVSGIKAINKGAPYKLAAIVTFGNFYIAATGNDDNGVMDKGDTIVLFGQGITPDLVFHYIYGNEYDEEIEYVSAVSDAGKVLAAGKNFETGNEIDYVFMAEPVLTNILSNKEASTYGQASVYENIQELYISKTNSNMIQAGIFVKNGYDYNDFLTSLSNNIEFSLSNTSYSEELLKDKDVEEVSSIFGIGTNMIENVLKTNSIGLGYTNAYDNKEAIDKIISIFGMQETNEEIYYK